MYKNLHSYLTALEQQNDLLRITSFVNPELEITEITDRVFKNGGKALLFENNGTEFPVLMNMFGSTERMCKAIGINSFAEVEQRIDKLFSAALSPKNSLWEKLRLLPTLAQAAQWMPKIIHKRGACQQVVMPQPDLGKLPILKCWPHDGGRFVTLPMVHTKDAETGLRNVGMYRMQVFSPATVGMHWHRHKTGAKHFSKCTERYFPVAVALGGDPVYTYCSMAPMPENMDEYLLAGFLRNKRVNLVKCLTQPLEVPEDADFVMEGYIDTQAPLVTEGPFGDHTGFYSLEDVYPLMQITCITHRKDAVYPATIVGIPPQEDAYMAQATEKIFLAPIRLALVPEIEDLHMPFEGVTHNIAIVKIKKDYPGQAQKVANALWGAGQMMFNKILIVVDGDVDITNYGAVAERIKENYSPETDTYFSQGPLDVLDHAAAINGFGGKICMDATSDTAAGSRPSSVGSETQSANKATKQSTHNKNKSELYSFIYKGTILPQTPIIVEFDAEVDITDIATCIWLLGNNIDAVRDCRIVNGQLIMDATRKIAVPDNKPTQHFPARWPNVVCSSDETIDTIDRQWDSLGIGAFIPSPSLNYKKLVKPGKARVAL